VHDIRRAIHAQMKMLWNSHPTLNFILGHPEHKQWYFDATRKQIDGNIYQPLVCPALGIGAKLDILFLRPSKPGALFKDGGDLDNRLKTLIDGLRIPAKGETPDGVRNAEDEQPMYCLLADDKLVTAFSVESDQLFETGHNEAYVRCQVRVALVGIEPTALAADLLR